jgi:hypothetical protein
MNLRTASQRFTYTQKKCYLPEAEGWQRAVPFIILLLISRGERNAFFFFLHSSLSRGISRIRHVELKVVNDAKRHVTTCRFETAMSRNFVKLFSNIFVDN